MAERFTQLYKLQDNLYISGSPIIISAGSLLLDTETGNVVAQLKFHSISNKIIKAIKISLSAYDISEKELQAIENYQYLDLHITNGQYFGQNKAIVFPDLVTRSFSIKSISVVFGDKSYWEWDSSILIEALPYQQTLYSSLKNKELEMQYKLITNENAVFVPLLYKDIWLCACGEANNGAYCTKCKIPQKLAFDSLNKEVLTVQTDKRLASEKKEQEIAEQQNEILKQKKYKHKNIFNIFLRAIAITVSLVIVVAIANTIINKIQLSNYRDQNFNYNAVYAGYYHTVAVSEDGTVVATGDNEYGQCEISKWRNIVSVSAGVNHTAGLKANGTVIVIGDTYFSNKNICDFSQWKDIVQITSGQSHIVGLKKDGTVLLEGIKNDVSSWRDIVQISAGQIHTVGLKSDGTVVAAGSNYEGECNVSEWTDIVEVSAGTDYTVGLKKDGTVLLAGSNRYGAGDVKEWSDISSICAGLNHTVALKTDGTVVATGRNEYGQCNVTDWHDIVKISVGAYHTIGLKADGTVLATGQNDNGQCDVTEWEDIYLPNK